MCSSFQERRHFGRTETFPVPWNLKRVSSMTLLEILTSLAIAHWLIFLAIFTIFIFISLEILDVIIFTMFNKKSMLLRKNICILAMENHPVLKYFILIDLWKVAKNLCMVIFFGMVLHFPLSFGNSNIKCLRVKIVQHEECFVCK